MKLLRRCLSSLLNCLAITLFSLIITRNDHCIHVTQKHAIFLDYLKPESTASTVNFKILMQDIWNEGGKLNQPQILSNAPSTLLLISI